MAKLAQNFAKYLINAMLRAKGVVERPDVIGAIFGQTEGLLGADLDLRELQRTGRVGRIEVNVVTKKGKSESSIIIPSSLDASETSLIAAALETIEKVGPCDAEIEVSQVEDVRSQKRRYVIDRAKEILKDLMEEGQPDSQKISEMVKESVRSWEVSSYNGLTCGPNIQEHDEIIIVEGRADVINLLKNGIKNVIAIEGSKIPKTVVDLTKEKITTAFLDGDRGGDLDLKRLLHIADVDFIARAEAGKEVEELSKKQIFKALRERIPSDQALAGAKGFTPAGEVSEEQTVQEELEEEHAEHEAQEQAREEQAHQQQKAEPELSTELLIEFKKLSDELIGTHAAYLIDDNLNTISKVPITELQSMLNEFPDVFAVVCDSKIDQAMIDAISQKNIEYLIGTGFKERVRAPYTLKLLTPKNFNAISGIQDKDDAE